jgi:hypothetical protein
LDLFGVSDTDVIPGEDTSTHTLAFVLALLIFSFSGLETCFFTGVSFTHVTSKAIVE